jgi:predicted RNase H-like nuclease (RuvC/YqgF family)
MKTFIEQKAELRGEIEQRERENESLFNRIDHNETTITELKKKLEQVGTEV